MAIKKILIAVKTYPTLSLKHQELACTAGFREDGSWIRLYPIRFRFLEDDKRYKKYQWVELDVVKNKSDNRPESYRPVDVEQIELGEYVDTKNNWEERRRLVLDKNVVYTNLSELISLARDRNELSLAIFKPAKVLDFIAEPVETDWPPEKEKAIIEGLKQKNMFDEDDYKDFRVMPKLPYKFSFKIADESGKESTMMIEDWETGQLYWTCVEKYGEKKAPVMVRKKYYDDFALTKDFYLFLGTTARYHNWASNPFVIIGTFHPPFIKQSSLF